MIAILPLTCMNKIDDMENSFDELFSALSYSMLGVPLFEKKWILWKLFFYKESYDELYLIFIFLNCIEEGALKLTLINLWGNWGVRGY